MCYTDDTITCWHHAFTFNLDDGRICCLLNDPESSLAGRKGIKSYPVREEKGVIFTFVGDMNPPPPLEQDVPPGFFDEDVAICVADPYLVQANWRLGSEGLAWGEQERERAINSAVENIQHHFAKY